jgi:hypothetical protein
LDAAQAKTKMMPPLLALDFVGGVKHELIALHELPRLSSLILCLAWRANGTQFFGQNASSLRTFESPGVRIHVQYKSRCIHTHPPILPPTHITYCHTLPIKAQARPAEDLCMRNIFGIESLSLHQLSTASASTRISVAFFTFRSWKSLSLSQNLSLSLSRTRVHALAFSPSPTRAFFSRVTHKHSHSRAHTQISLMHLDIRDENRESIITQSNILFKVHLKPS